MTDNIATSLDKNNSQQIVTTATGDEDEEYDIPDEIEDILGILVLSLYIHVHEIMSRPHSWRDILFLFVYLSVHLSVSCGKSVVFPWVLQFPSPIKLTTRI